jgi:hypothetical protein
LTRDYSREQPVIIGFSKHLKPSVLRNVSASARDCNHSRVEISPRRRLRSENFYAIAANIHSLTFVRYRL